MAPLIAVNICLVSPSFDGAAIPLSWSLCPAEGYADMQWDKDKSYRLKALEEKVLHRGFGYPHCTVAQLCIAKTDMDALRKLVRQIWIELRETLESKEKLCLTTLDNGPAFAKTADGTEIRLPNIVIEPSETLCELHKQIVTAVKPFHVSGASLEEGRAAFHPSFPADNDITVDWMMDYLSKYALKAYRPHITLGASPVVVTETSVFKSIHVPWRDCRLVVSRMGNYCSCFEIQE
ncbi:uncharacterized protein TM35_000082190 [Trypanosoma theileri]|uniref:Uncharacterized protein n=1 Tax=Trypanosoma theileri TaxID=67003 RepID=A0A1X0P0Q7_9TRYP|nr:uncharacterized protein TM35_000082190 [Trypanosoma theileri]ORC90421.1 hypothetical protein TM35_000082190 [Trypanosoma theileri]